MKAFAKFEPEEGVVCYQLLFEKDEYIAVFQKRFGGSPIYDRMQYRKHGEEAFSILNEVVWSLAISQARKIVEALDKLEIDPHGGLFSAD